MHLDHAIFEGNSSGSGGQGLGGAVLAVFDANVVADNTVFSQNQSTNGGAVELKFLPVPSTIAVFNSCLFTKNAATDKATVFTGLKANFTNCTFSYNNNNGIPGDPANQLFGLPESYDESVRRYNITNCIFNTDRIYNNYDGLLTTKYNVRNSLINQTEFNIAGNHNNIGNDPHFTDAANEKGADGMFGTPDDGLQLSGISPCVNAGDNTVAVANFPTTDLKNEARLYNNGVIDMGCYELQGAMNSNIPLAATFSTTDRNVSSEPVVVINGNDQLVASLVNLNSNNIRFLNQYRIVQNAGLLPNGTYQPYVPNSFHISQENGTPSLPAGNALKMTFYCSQALFDNYNQNNGSDPDLPTGPSDVNGIANIKIWKYHGNPNASCNVQNILPSCYNGGVQVFTPETVIWNNAQARWELTFRMSTFSGLYITGRTLNALPLTLVAFNAVKKQNAVELNWATTQEQNSSYFEIERSKNGVGFTAIGIVGAIGEQHRTKRICVRRCRA